MPTVNDVADFLLRHAGERSTGLDPLKLQKLCYYAQGLCLARYGEPLFTARMEAWDHGPVVPSLYHRFKHHRSSPIPAPPAGGASVLDARHQILLIEVHERFGDVNSAVLSRRTHGEAPWQTARCTRERHAEITVGALSEYFKSAFPMPEPPSAPSEQTVARASRLLAERADVAEAVARGRADADKGRLLRW